MLTGAVFTFLTLCNVQYIETTQDMFIPQINIEIFFSLMCVPLHFSSLSLTIRNTYKVIALVSILTAYIGQLVGV